MTETLKHLLDRQASSVAFASPDVDAITRTGSRRIRRRRAMAVLGGIAAVALVGGAAVVLGDDGGGRDPVVASGDRAPAAVTWATGSTIHVGDQTIDVGQVVRAYVRTSAGFVVLDDADVVYSVTSDGVTEIGRMTATKPNILDQQRLAADPRGSLVGWVGENPAGELTLETYDQESGVSRSYPAPGARPPDDALFFAIDDRTAYWRTPAGVFAVDLDTGSERPVLEITGDSAHDFEVYSVEDGVMAFSPSADGNILVGRSVSEAQEVIDFRAEAAAGATDPIRLSPTGAWLSFGVARSEGASEDSITIVGIEPEVYDLATGQHVTLALPGDPALAIPRVWLDDATLMVVGLSGPLGADSGASPDDLGLTLYRCTMPDASCELASEIGAGDSSEPSAEPVLPDGRWYGPEEPEGGDG
jgi:hypothetical protein